MTSLWVRSIAFMTEHFDTLVLCLHEINLERRIEVIHPSFVERERGGLGEMLPQVMIFSDGFSPRVISSSLRVTFHRVLRANGLYLIYYTEN